MVAVMETDTPEPERLTHRLEPRGDRQSLPIDDPLAGQSPGAPVTALLVIDDAGRLDEVARFLIASGLEVETVSDPYLADGLAVPGHRYAVILLDVLLPVRELYRLCRRLRSSGRVPMVIASWEDRSELDAGPGDRVVPHSITPAELAGRVKAVLTVEARQQVRD